MIGTEDEEYEQAVDHPAFSNGAEGETWMAVWCATCVRDEDECPLVGVAIFGRTPVQWISRNPQGMRDKYVCTEWVAE